MRRTQTHALSTWRRLLRLCGKPPWELTEGDMEAYKKWMEEQGYAANTLRISLGLVINFYRWCGEKGINPQC